MNDEKLVYVRTYVRKRFGVIERVRQHWRRYPPALIAEDASDFTPNWIKLLCSTF